MHLNFPLLNALWTTNVSSLTFTELFVISNNINTIATD